VVGHHKTSISLEDVFWNELRAIARERKVHLSELVDEIDSGRMHSNLSSAIRLFVFDKRRRRN
jgi:predicted DNA-binding ribbon-helix-helix protein